MKSFILKHSTIAILIVALSTSGLSCKLFQSNVPAELSKPITLEYWGVWHDTDDLKPFIDEYKNQHANVNIKYKKFRLGEYRQKLLEAWAEDRGPDIYQIPAGWLGEFESRITPMPKNVKLVTSEVKTTFGKAEVVRSVKTVNTPTSNDIKNQYVDLVYKDVVKNDKIYGLPLSLDTLALFYNRTILDNAKVATAPTTWDELNAAVKAITELQGENNIVQSAIALGTTNNIPRSVDIISTIMQQNGAVMVKDKQVTFSQVFQGSSPTLNAINFYRSFAEPLTEIYTWNESMPDALEAFIAGKTAMFFGYSYQIPIIKGRSPKLNFGVAPMTQISGQKSINTANYWVETVSHKTKSIDNSWGFLNFITSQEQAKKFTEKTQQPAALRLILAGQKQSPMLSIFADQALTATRWYTGKNEPQMEQYFVEMFNQVLKTPTPEKQQEVLNVGARRISETLQ